MNNKPVSTVQHRISVFKGNIKQKNFPHDKNWHVCKQPPASATKDHNLDPTWIVSCKTWKIWTTNMVWFIRQRVRSWMCWKQLAIFFWVFTQLYYLAIYRSAAKIFVSGTNHQTNKLTDKQRDNYCLRC